MASAEKYVIVTAEKDDKSGKAHTIIFNTTIAQLFSFTE